MKPSKFDAVGDAYECQEEGGGKFVSMWLSAERLRKADSWSRVSPRKPRNPSSAILFPRKQSLSKPVFS